MPIGYSNPIMQQINRTGNIMQYIDAMKYKRQQDAIDNARMRRIDAMNEQRNAFETSIMNKRLDAMDKEEQARNAFERGFKAPQPGNLDQSYDLGQTAPRDMNQSMQTGAQQYLAAGGDPMRGIDMIHKMQPEGANRQAINEIQQFLKNNPDATDDEVLLFAEKLRDARAPKPVKYPAISMAYAAGWFPSRRMSVGEMDALESGLQERINRGLPIDADFIRSSEFDSVKNKATGSSAGSRLTVARKQNIEAAFPLLDDIEITGKKLNYSNVGFLGRLEKYKNGQLNDPIFTEYMTQRADALFVLGNALKQNGLTDKAIEVEEEAATPTMAPRALSAWLNVQRRALNRAAHEMNIDYKYNIPTEPTVPAGQGGIGEKSYSNDKPPAPGARKAPDGNWYIKQNGKYYRVEQ